MRKNIVGGGGGMKRICSLVIMMWLKILLYIYFKNSEILLFSILENRTANIYAGLLFVKKR